MKEIFCVTDGHSFAFCDSLETAKKEMSVKLAYIRKVEAVGDICDVIVGEESLSYRWASDDIPTLVTIEKMTVTERMLYYFRPLSINDIDEDSVNDFEYPTSCGY